MTFQSDCEHSSPDLLRSRDGLFMCWTGRCSCNLSTDPLRRVMFDSTTSSAFEHAILSMTSTMHAIRDDHHRLRQHAMSRH